MMTSAAAQESRSVFASWAICFTAIDSPLVDGPMMAKTPCSSMSCLAKEMAFSGLPPVSLTRSSTLRPPTPPLALRASTSISRVRASGAPRKEAGPVTARRAPTRSGSASAAEAWNEAASASAAAASLIGFMGSCLPGCPGYWPCSANLPPLTVTISKASTSRPLWSVGEKLKTPEVPTNPLVDSSAARTFSRSGPPACSSALTSSARASWA